MSERAIAYFAELADQNRHSPSLSRHEISVMLLLQEQAEASSRWAEGSRLAKGVDVSLAVSGIE